MKNSVISLHGTDQDITVQNISLKLLHIELFQVRIIIAPEHSNFDTFIHQLSDNG